MEPFVNPFRTLSLPFEPFAKGSRTQRVPKGSKGFKGFPKGSKGCQRVPGKRCKNRSYCADFAQKRRCVAQLLPPKWPLLPSKWHELPSKWPLRARGVRERDAWETFCPTPDAGLALALRASAPGNRPPTGARPPAPDSGWALALRARAPE